MHEDGLDSTWACRRSARLAGEGSLSLGVRSASGVQPLDLGLTVALASSHCSSYVSIRVSFVRVLLGRLA